MSTQLVRHDLAEVVAAVSHDHAQSDRIVVRDLSVTFGSVPRLTRAVRDVSFELEAGRCVALVGESGSGKSVTARTLLGLAGPGATVTASELSVGGVDLSSIRGREWRRFRGRPIGMVLQDALTSLDPLRRIEAEVAESPLIHGLWRRAEVSRRVDELLARVGIPDPGMRRRQFANQLSGGLRQRALIASALAAEPQFLIADEPTTALDVTVQAQVLEVLREEVRDGMGLLLISHDLAVVSQLADEILVLRNGEVVERGAPDRILHNPEHEYTRMLVRAVPAFASRGTRLSGESVDVDALHRVIADGDHTTVTRSGGGSGPQQPVFRVSAVMKRFRLNRTEHIDAVRGISLELHRGEILGVVGESGSGKSTLGRLLLAYDEPDRGTVEFCGNRWSGRKESERRRDRWAVQAISQDPLGSFDPRYTVHRVLDEALGSIGLSKAQRRDREQALLSAVGLDETLLSRYPRQLSGGERQRLAIARALATGARVLVCDEAVSALDVSIQAQVLDLLLDLREYMDLSVVFISHDLAVVHYLCDRVIVVHDGVIVEEGTSEKVFHEPTSEYTRSLVDSLPRLS